MTFVQIVAATSGLILASDENTVQDRVQDDIWRSEGLNAGSFVFTYNADGTVSGVSASITGSAESFNFSYFGDGRIGSVVETREDKTVTNVFAYNASDQVSQVTRTVA